MSFTGKLNAGMSNFTKSMKNGADNCRLDGKISEQQKKIKLLTKEIANLAILKLDAGEEMCPEIMERYIAIKESRETIATLEKERKITKVVCPSCGAKTSADMKYCGRCGAEMKNLIPGDVE